ncbi:hypothetical protein VTO42DRAFT_5875 [Malbranchea cinnamomea]
MPLHLLGKKSWNVYNKDNIARVRRDEALAKEQEEREKREEQRAAAERRLQILRGLREPTPPDEQQQREEGAAGQDVSAVTRERREHRERQRKRRRLAGENDTDRDIRLAREDVLEAEARRTEVALRKPSGDAPIVDEAGHINLFPVEQSRDRRNEKNREAEAETGRKSREFEDPYTMRFSNAAGYNRGMEQPWYSSSGRDLSLQTEGMPTKDVWGNEDLRRREREKARIDANDPLAAIKKGVRQLREVEREKKKWEEERKRELEVLKQEQRESKRRRRRNRSRSRSPGSSDSLENFRLDDDGSEDRERRRRKHKSRRHSHEDKHRRSSDFRSHSSCHSRRQGGRDKESRLSTTSRADAAWNPAPGKRYSAQFANP